MIVVFVNDFTGSTIDGELITGNKYEAEIVSDSSFYMVINEKGEKQVYVKRLFKTISEIRDEKLEDLGI